MSGRSELAFFGVAVALHLGGLGVARAFPNLNPLTIDRHAAVDVVEVEIPDLPKTITEDRRIEDPRLPPDPDRRDVAMRTEDRPLRHSTNPNPSAPTTEGPTTEGGATTEPGPQLTQPDGDTDWGAPEGGSWAPPGLGKGGPIYNTGDLMAMGKAPAAPTAAPRAAAIDPKLPSNLINDAILKKDRELGLDLPAAGNVKNALVAATLASDAPADSRASFVVSLSPDGKVTGVKFVSASAGSADTWTRVAAAAKSALAAQKFALNERFSKGATISVNVLSKMQMPSGAKVGSGIELSLTQHFDVADIGAKPVRAVSGSATATPIK
ncbi:MAG TPA: hypothetical protein VL400_23810 [Polyangiaceae bacterium]|nr:hypothetical protein [Polyangiaceae bacterium]